MKKMYAFISLLSLSFCAMAQPFVINGSTTKQGAHEYQLTPTQPDQVGAVWSSEKIDLRKDFTVKCQIFFGYDDGGADGMAFVLQPLGVHQLGNTDLGGMGLGYYQIRPSLAVEFDTWANFEINDPEEDHLAFMRSGDIAHNSDNNPESPYLLPDIEDGQWHDAVFTWTASTHTLTVSFLSNSYTLQEDIVKTLFGGAPYVYWGFTGATGAATNDQRVRIINAPEVTITCPGNKSVATDKGKCTAIVYDIDPIISGATMTHVSYTLTGATTGSGTGTVSGKTFNKGVTTVTYTLASDANKSCSFTVTVQDREAPVITNASANPSLLWPPNHKLQEITVDYTVTDNCGATATLSVKGNDGATASDWQVVDAHHVWLRAERSGKGDGRTYTITITATDVSGNKSTKTVDVLVPHDRSGKFVVQKGGDNSELLVQVLPNPSQHDFTLHVNSSSDKPIQVWVSNAVGKTIEVLQNTNAKGTVRLGSDYAAGIYYAEVVQGSSRAVVKLVKVDK